MSEITAPAAEAASEPISEQVSENVETSSSKAPETQAELAEQVDEALQKGDKKAAEKLIKEYEIKVNGKTKKVSLDLSNEKDIIRRLQLAEAAQPAMQKSAELEKMLNLYAKELRTNPWAVLEELGLNPDDLAADRLQKKVEEMKKSPEQLEKEKMQKELEQLRAEAERQKKDADEARLHKAQLEAQAELDEEITEALNKNPKLPKTAKTVGRIADALIWAMNNGFPDARVEDVIPMVEKDIKNEFDEFLANTSDDVLEYYVNQKIQERFRQKRLTAAKKAQSVPTKVKEVAKPSEKVEEKPRSKIKDKDFFRSLR